MVENAPLQIGEQRRGLQSQLGAQPAAPARERSQGIGLTAAAVERHRLRGAQAFPQRIAGDQRLDLGQRLAGAAEPEQGVGAILERVEARALAALRECLEIRRLEPEQGRPRQSASAASSAARAAA